MTLNCLVRDRINSTGYSPGKFPDRMPSLPHEFVDNFSGNPSQKFWPP